MSKTEHFQFLYTDLFVHIFTPSHHSVTFYTATIFQKHFIDYVNMTATSFGSSFVFLIVALAKINLIRCMLYYSSSNTSK